MFENSNNIEKFDYRIELERFQYSVGFDGEKYE
jgi:hypothetical protein